MIFLEKVAAKYPGDYDKLSSMSIIEEGPVKKIRMANLVIKKYK
jgi:starch phosphorylase